MTTPHFDVLIVGAGISGIGAAYHLTQECPGRRFVVLEGQAGYGGTWRTHTYPGIRSDRDLYTFGYRFKPCCSARPRTSPRDATPTSWPTSSATSTSPRGTHEIVRRQILKNQAMVTKMSSPPPGSR